MVAVPIRYPNTEHSIVYAKWHLNSYICMHRYSKIYMYLKSMCKWTYHVFGYLWFSGGLVSISPKVNHINQIIPRATKHISEGVLRTKSPCLCFHVRWIFKMHHTLLLPKRRKGRVYVQRRKHIYSDCINRSMLNSPNTLPHHLGWFTLSYVYNSKCRTEYKFFLFELISIINITCT